MSPSSGTLYVVSTPIGNLGDMTYRAVEVLRAVPLICAEDTRHVRKLLQHYDIQGPLQAYYKDNEARMTPKLVERLTSGEDLALVSDAGTPLLSDPGQRLVTAAIAAGVPVVPIPGASSLLAALVPSGADISSFTFVGFLPRSGGDRTRALSRLSALGHTSVLFEAPTRLAATLQDLAAAGMNERRVTVARELTKKHEEIRRGTVAELAAYYRANQARGEVVLVLEGGVTTPAFDETAPHERVRALRARGASAKEIVAVLMNEFGMARNRAYRLTQETIQ